MTNNNSQIDSRSTSSPRIWPAVAIILILWLALQGVSSLSENGFVQFLVMFWGPIAAALLFLVWWSAFSRLPWRERLVGLAAFALAAGGTFVARDKSMGFMGMCIYGLPLVLTAWAVWIVVSRNGSRLVRGVGTAAVIVLAWGYLSLVRLDGVFGDMKSTINWRWTPTAEDQFLAARAEAHKSGNASPAKSGDEVVETLTQSEGDWPEFRGPERDGRVHGVRIDTDWGAHPPKQVWRQRIGPGWSSFAIIGDRLFTQEQRGDDEATVCYRASTGEELWAHLDKTRFWEVVAGAGPRATPTFHEGRLYALGANGKLTCLDPVTGKSHWSADIVADSGAKVPIWGFSSSPLIVDNKVIVFAGGPNNKAVLAYAIDDGKLAWAAGNGTHSYSSAHTLLIDEKPQVLVMSDMGLAAYDPADGKTLWQHDWPMEGMARIVQPHLLDGNRIVIGSGSMKGARMITVSHEGDAWKANEGWTSNDLKPYFNDFVSRDGVAYGFDGSIFCCIDLETGKRKWKKGRYGHGQVLLLADQDVMLVLGEKGECVLVEVNPEKLVELAQFPALEGKTWNHPVIAHGKLFVRNGEEMACYELKMEPTTNDANLTN